MSYINNLFSLNRNLSKKYRLGTTKEDFDPVMAMTSEDNDVNNPPKVSAAKPVPSPPQSRPANTINRQPATTVPPIKPVTGQQAPGQPATGQPATPTSTSTPTSSQPKATSKDNFIKNAANRGIGAALATKNFISKVADDYAKKRMETFLYFGGGFSPAMREKVMTQSNKDFQNFITQSHLKGKGFSLFGDDYAKLHTIFDKLHATKMTGAARQHAIEEMFKKHTSKGGHFSDHNLDDIIKEANRLHGKNNKSNKPGQEGMTDTDKITKPGAMTT